MENQGQELVVRGGHASGAPGAVTIRGRTYQSIGEVIAQVSQIQDPGERFEEQRNMLEQIEVVHNTVADAVETFFQWVESDKAYQAADISQDQFYEMFPEQRFIILENARRRDRDNESVRAVKNAWQASTRAIAWVDGIDKTGNFTNALRSLALSDKSFQSCASKINAAVQARLQDRSRGAKKDPWVTTKDLEHAKAGMYRQGALNMELDMDFLQSRGLRVGRCGILQLDDGRPDELMAEEDPAPESPDSPMVLDTPELQPSRRSNRLNARQRRRAEEEFDITPIAQEHVDEEEIQDIEDQLAEHAEVEEYEELPGGKRQRTGRIKKSGCGCSGDVTSHWQTLILKKSKLPDATQLRLLSTMVGFKDVCFHHARAMSSHLGLMNNNLNKDGLHERLRYIHENRLRIGTLKTQNETFQWWRKAARPPHPSDMLGVYKFQRKQPAADFSFDQAMVIAHTQQILGIDFDVIGAWNMDGNVNLPIFKWWIEDPVLLRYIDDEFEMYRYHLRRANNRPNFGWQRSQYHSIAQQLMRQDIVYYMAYAGLRPDKFWRLVSYPYYTKYATSEDGVSTYFRHIDINIPDAVDHDRGTSMIQGSVSLDDETDTDSTVLLKGFHHRIKEWWTDCRARGVPDSKAYVHRVEPENYTKADIKKYGNWVNVPCKAGDARITMSTIPHGAAPTTSQRRRTMLPWFVGLQDDLETLELTEGGTWSDLSIAHTTLVAAKSSPSGLNSMYNTIPFRFPGAVELDGLGALSSALVCRKVWNSPTVLAERNLLLGPDFAAIHSHVQRWRANAKTQAIQAYEAAIRAEKEAFQNKSYYALRELGHDMEDMLNMDPDWCQIEDGGDAADGMRFAEDSGTAGA